MFHGLLQSSGETNWYWYRLKANLDQVFNLGLSLSQHFWGETFWCVDKWCRSPAWGSGRLGGVFWEYKTVLAHKVCMFLSLDWMAGHDPGFSNSLCIQNSSLCIPRCVSSTQSHACKLHCWKTWYDGATWSWSRWCTPHTSPPPPARPPWSRPPPPGRQHWWWGTCPRVGSHPSPPASSSSSCRCRALAHLPQVWAAWPQPWPSCFGRRWSASCWALWSRTASGWTYWRLFLEGSHWGSTCW